MKYELILTHEIGCKCQFLSLIVQRKRIYQSYLYDQLDYINGRVFRGFRNYHYQLSSQQYDWHDRFCHNSFVLHNVQ